MLNETSKYILDSCDGTRTVGEILDLLCVKYKDVEKEKIGADLEATLFNLTRIRVIRWKGENDMNNTPFWLREEKLEKNIVYRWQRKRYKNFTKNVCKIL